MKIAWIEDDIDIIDPVVRPLVQDGHDFIRIRTIREALTSVPLIRTCDLILLDMIIPPGDTEGDYGTYSGISLLKRLREEHDVWIPVVVFSVVDPSKVKDQLAEWNVAGYIRKPALPSELKEAVDVVLKLRARHERRHAGSRSRLVILFLVCALPKETHGNLDSTMTIRVQVLHLISPVR